MTWEFRAIRNVAGSAMLADLLPEQEKRIPYYIAALRSAERTNVPNPRFSNFYVRSSAGVYGNYAEGGNIEYGFCQALHSEESVVAALRSKTGRQNDLPIIAFSSLGIEPTCCGNCRDILFDEFGSGEIVSGPPSGGIASVATFDDIRFDDFREFDPPPDLCDLAEKTFTLGALLLKDAYSGQQRPERNYFVGIKTKGNLYVGAHDVGCDYHPIYAGRDAMRQARRACDPYIENVVVVSGERPHVMYKDRQHLLELNVDGEMLAGRDRNPPIFLFSFRDGVTGAWEASLKETLPFPFLVTAFGNDFISYYREWCRKTYT